jgi:5-methylcytosine-specific restriction endonuclease McrA
VPRRKGKKDPTQWTEDNHDKAIPGYVQERVIRDADHHCRGCGADVRAGRIGHVDHIFPLQDGGKHAFPNLQYLCAVCHGAKTSKENSTRAKGNRVFAKTYGIAKPKRKPFYQKRERSTLPIRVAWIDEQGRDRVTWLKHKEIPEGE